MKGYTLPLLTLVLAFLSPALANPRVNHADLYGYPHGRGDHSGARGPVPANNPPMTPGGYVDPRPENQGADCRYNSQCSTGMTNARGICTADGKCSYQCLGATKFDGIACSGSIVSRRCSFDKNCRTNVRNGSAACIAGHCTFACDDGFYAFGSTCKAVDPTCGATQCPSVSGGYNACENNTCVTHCNAYLGYHKYCNGDVCQCMNTDNDALNCGGAGNVCPGGYNGKGRAYCYEGTCQLSCYRLTKLTVNGNTYCS